HEIALANPDVAGGADYTAVKKFGWAGLDNGVVYNVDAIYRARFNDFNVAAGEAFLEGAFLAPVVTTHDQHLQDWNADATAPAVLAPPGSGTRTDGVYLDLYLDPQANGPVLIMALTVSDSAQNDYVDGAGFQHWVEKIADIERTTSERITASMISDTRREVHYGPADGLAYAADAIKADTIAELTAGNGVDIDNLKIQDGRALFDTRWFQNLVIKNNTTNPAYQVDIDADFLVVEGWKFDSANLTADITASGANGLDTGAEAASTWYHLWAIADVSDPAAPVIAGLLSLQYPGSGTDPTLPTGYTKRQYIGAAYNNSSSNFSSFSQLNRRVATVATSVLNVGSATSFTSIALATVVPPNAVWAGGYLLIQDPNSVNAYGELASTSAGLGKTIFQVHAVGSGTTAMTLRTSWELTLVEPDTLYYLISSSVMNIAVSQFEVPL
ncbi:MAG: hypothetical protein IID61_15005, partial [SAR324 cluster bacterium]|nr:hypothetical protein [SAR324 cluster bacterium]